MNSDELNHPEPGTGGSEAQDPVIRPVSYARQTEEVQRKLPLTRFQLALILVAVPILIVLWFLFTAKSVRLEFTPAADSVSISGGMNLELSGVYLLTRGDYEVTAEAAGYQPLKSMLKVTSERNQTVRLAFEKLPGRVTFESEPPGAQVSLQDAQLGITPTSPLEVAAGTQRVTMTRDRYQPLTLDVEIVGLDQPQTVSGRLIPNWADVTVNSVPAGAQILVDDTPTGQATPAVVQLLSGEHEIRLKAPGHKSHRQRILVAPLEQVQLPLVTLQQADGLLTVRTDPGGAGITLDGQFQGEAPIEIAVQSGRSYRVQVFKAGYAPRETAITLQSGEERQLRLNLEQLTGKLVITALPETAQLTLDGRPAGNANQTLTLPTVPHTLAISLPGYAGYSTRITPKNGLTQEVKVRLLTLEEARLAALQPRVTTSQGQELVLLSPKPFTMGASRREPGRRANETLHEVDMQRLFYLGTREVTNEQFRAFAAGHDSGKFEEYDLNEDDHPVANVSWTDAALYCNWLSDRDGLPRFYRTERGKITGANPAATGYRLPTEAEWAWSARQVGVKEQPLRFPWGANLPPPDRHGNYADRSASHLVGRVIFGYNDNHIVSAPVATFPADPNGVFDLAGNVAEWVHDFYAIPEAAPSKDPLGPGEGEYHVIRGSSWMQGTITDLRISFRDYGTDGRQDVGFRLARFAESS